MKNVRSLLPWRLAAAALALSLSGGCDSSDEDNTGPLYAVTTQDLNAEVAESYVVVTSQAEQAAQLSLDNAIKVSGRALGVGIRKSGSLYVVSDDSPTVTRYTLNDEGRLEQSGTVSFASLGVTSLGEYQANFQFVSDTKAYFFDGITAQAVIWNPSAMTVTGSTAQYASTRSTGSSARCSSRSSSPVAISSVRSRSRSTARMVKTRVTRRR